MTLQIHSLRLRKSVIRVKRYVVFAVLLVLVHLFMCKVRLKCTKQHYADMVIDDGIKCSRTLATRILSNHNGDLVAQAVVVAGVVG